MSDEEGFQYVKRTLPIFRAVVKFCSSNRLIRLFVNIKGVASSENQRNIFRRLFVSYFIIKQNDIEAEEHIVFQQCKSFNKPLAVLGISNTQNC